MRYLALLALIACTPPHKVVTWASVRPGIEERIIIQSDGDIHYVSLLNGTADKTEKQRLTREQLRDLADVLKSQHACELASAPGYAPEAGEGKTTLEIAFPDQQCKVTLWDREWRTGTPRDIADTMRSMRLKPMHPN